MACQTMTSAGRSSLTESYKKFPPQSKNFNDSIQPYKDNHTHKLNPRALAFYPISHPPGHNTHPNVEENTLQTPHRSCNLCVLQFNARSLLPKMPEVIHLASQKNPDIIAVTETWLSSQIPNGAIHINGYNLTVQTDRQNNKRGGGTAIYVRLAFTLENDTILRHGQKEPGAKLWDTKSL